MPSNASAMPIHTQREAPDAGSATWGVSGGAPVAVGGSVTAVATAEGMSLGVGAEPGAGWALGVLLGVGVARVLAVGLGVGCVARAVGVGVGRAAVGDGAGVGRAAVGVGVGLGVTGRGGASPSVTGPCGAGVPPGGSWKSPTAAFAGTASAAAASKAARCQRR